MSAKCSLTSFFPDTVLFLLLLMVTYTTFIFLPGHLRHLAGIVLGV